MGSTSCCSLCSNHSPFSPIGPLGNRLIVCLRFSIKAHGSEERFRVCGASYTRLLFGQNAARDHRLVY